MGLFSLDFFRCEPFELNFRMFVIGGFWPLDTANRTAQIFFSVFSFLCYFSVTSMIMIQFVDLYLLRNDFDKFAKDMTTICISFVIVAKGHLVLFNADEVLKLRAEISRYKATRTDPEDLRILERSNRAITFITKVFYGITFTCVLTWFVYPALDSRGERNTPFPYTLPSGSVDQWSDTEYIVVYVYQALSMQGFAFKFLAVDTIFCGFILRINAHYDIVIKNLKALGGADDCADIDLRAVEVEPSEEQKAQESARVMKILRENVKLHQQILKQIESLQSIYNSSSFVHFVGVTTIFATAIYDLAKISNELRLQLVQRMLYVMVAIWDTFLYCYFASLLHQKSTELSLAAYEARWYKLKPKVRTYLQFISMKCQKVPKITVGKLFALELKTFLNIMKISYDVTALLYQSNRKRD